MKCRFGLMVCLAVVGPALRATADDNGSATDVTDNAQMFSIWSEQQAPAPIDYGNGLGAPKQSALVDGMLSSLAGFGAATPDAAPTGGGTAAKRGVFGAPLNWPINMVHLVLLPDGRVMNYGTDERGNQGAQVNAKIVNKKPVNGNMFFDVWNPAKGTGAASHTELTNTLKTDIFCSGQTVLTSGHVLLTGGDVTINGARNYSSNATTVFYPGTNTIANATKMAYPRWYPTIVPMANGGRLVIGGRSNLTAATEIPELMGPTGNWTVLKNARTPSFANDEQWFYPRGFLGPDGYVYIIGFDRNILKMGTAGEGSVTTVGQNTMKYSADHTNPDVMFAPGKILAIRSNNKAEVVNINGKVPVSTPTSSTIEGREWGNTTLLANGEVFLDGGSGVPNVMTNNGYTSEVWNPNTGQWTLGPVAKKPRMYHNNAILLTDGTVLTGGTGSPGPILELNAEIYYPAYLYAANGEAAARPTLVGAPAVAKAGAKITVTLGSTAAIKRVTFLRTGSATHSFNTEQRFLDLTGSLKQNGTALSVTLPTSSNELVPGYWMIFVFNAAGVPSVAKVINVEPS